MRTTVFRHLLPMMLLLAFVQGAASAQDRDEVSRVVRGGVVYEKQNDGTWKCTGYDSSDTNFDGNITILSKLENLPDHDEPVPVTEIVEWAFNDKHNNVDTKEIKGVVISKGIKVIGEFAFNRCVNITHITLPSTIESVGEGAFRCGDNLRWVDCRKVGEEDEGGAWKNQLEQLLSNDDYFIYGGPVTYFIDNDFTLLYMPSWWKRSGTNIVLTEDGGRTCQEFHYSRDMDYCVPYGFTAEKITVPEDQKLAADEGAYSVCLPYSLPVPDGAKAYKLKRRDNLDVYFSRITGEMEPFKPYLIVATEEIALDCNSERDILTTEAAEAQLTTNTANGVTIHGTLKQIGNTKAAEGTYYVLQANNEWKKVAANTTVTVPPYRAYLTLDQAQPTNFSIGFSDETDAISMPTAIPVAETQDDRWNTLSGQQLNGQPTSNGMFIHNGRKVVVR